MTDLTRTTIAAALILLTGAGGAAQDPPTGGDQRLDSVREALVGSYAGERHRLHVVQVESPPFEKPLYVELVRHGFEDRPDRQQLWWLYERDGQVRVRVNQFPPRIDALLATNLADLAVGTWGAPGFYPRIRSDQYDAVGDLLVTTQNGAVMLESEHPFAVSFGGAIDADVSISVDEDSLSWSEIGRDATGVIAWPSPDEVAPIEMQRLDATPKARQLDSGVIVVDLREGLPITVQGMDQVQMDDSVAVHFSGWLATGMMIDNSRLRDQPYIGKLPAPVIPGFTDALLGMRATNFARDLPPFSNTVRRAFIPPSRAFGAQGNPPIIPPNSSLIFNFEVQSIKADALAAPLGAEQPGQPQPERR